MYRKVIWFIIYVLTGGLLLTLAIVDLGLHPLSFIVGVLSIFVVIELFYHFRSIRVGD